MAGELYIYYKVPSEQRSSAAPAIALLQSRCRALGVTARLMRRRDVTSDGTETWMEVYGDMPDDFDVTLAELVQQTGVAQVIGERRAEWFIAC
jgi:hypothetical protein